MTDQICCARLKGRITHEAGNLGRLAQNAARRQGKGLAVTEAMKLELLEAKNTVATAKKVLEDHEAEHAGEVAA